LAIDAAAIIIDRAHAAWFEGSIAGVLLMDIKAAFLSVGWWRLVRTVQSKGIEGDLIRSMASCLAD
jgi:hypothetical protein